MSSYWIYLTATFIKIIFVLAGVLTLAAILTWMERRQSAILQDRIGPTRANLGRWKFWGLLHVVADGVKLAFKEDFVPPKGDKLLHSLSPFFAFIPVFIVFGIIPFSDDLCLMSFKNVISPQSEFCSGGQVIPMQIARIDTGLLIVFAFAGLTIIGAAIAGYASDNKYSLLGSLRAASQLISYEVTLGLTIVGLIMIYGTFEPQQMVEWQTSHHLWGIIIQPLAFILFLVVSIAENKRIPFDLPEGESEIVAGYFMEYGSMKFAMFFFAEFIQIIVISVIIVTLFFGGWHLPFLYRDGFHLFSNIWQLPHWIVLIIEAFVFGIKTFIFCWLQIMIRWTLPRFRYDQLMSLCWKIILPLSFLNIVLTGLIILLVTSNF